MGRRRPRQLELPVPRTWGGRRKGAGRKPRGDRPGVPHTPRPSHRRHQPVHVTLRAVDGLPSFRSPRLFAALLGALAAASKAHFRVCEFSVQSNHVHLLVEADSRQALIRGVQGLAIRTARAANRALGRRGPVWGDRYHARALTTPREVRNALVYVLSNLKKHHSSRRACGVDRCSSGPWFPGWRNGPPPPPDTCPVVPPETWLLGAGWRQHGLIDVDERPRAKSDRRARGRSDAEFHGARGPRVRRAALRLP